MKSTWKLKDAELLSNSTDCKAVLSNKTCWHGKIRSFTDLSLYMKSWKLCSVILMRAYLSTWHHHLSALCVTTPRWLAKLTRSQSLIKSEVTACRHAKKKYENWLRKLSCRKACNENPCTFERSARSTLATNLVWQANQFSNLRSWRSRKGKKMSLPEIRDVLSNHHYSDGVIEVIQSYLYMPTVQQLSECRKTCSLWSN